MVLGWTGISLDVCHYQNCFYTIIIFFSPRVILQSPTICTGCRHLNACTIYHKVQFCCHFSSFSFRSVRSLMPAGWAVHELVCYHSILFFYGSIYFLLYSPLVSLFIIISLLVLFSLKVAMLTHLSRLIFGSAVMISWLPARLDWDLVLNMIGLLSSFWILLTYSRYPCFSTLKYQNDMRNLNPTIRYNILQFACQPVDLVAR